MLTIFLKFSWARNLHQHLTCSIIAKGSIGLALATTLLACKEGPVAVVRRNLLVSLLHFLARSASAVGLRI
jgi:hypothetical protein